MSKIDKIEKLSFLFDLYRELLTDIQKNVFKDYYFDDLSLSEIANKNNKAKSSIVDTLKAAEEKLINYEAKLSLFKKSKELDKIIIELEKNGNKEIANKIKNI